jgi:heme-degrading monooxygenase HmoA
MIARVWKGTTAAADADAYTAYMSATGIVETTSLPGNRGAYVARRILGSATEFTFVSFWESMAAVRVFAGTNVEQAVFYPDDDRYLVTRWLTVEHHEVVAGDPAGHRNGAPNISHHAAAKADDTR